MPSLPPSRRAWLSFAHTLDFSGAPAYREGGREGGVLPLVNLGKNSLPASADRGLTASEVHTRWEQQRLPVGRSVGRLQLTRGTKRASGRDVCRDLPRTFTGGGSALAQTGPAVFHPTPHGRWGNV